MSKVKPEAEEVKPNEASGFKSLMSKVKHKYA